MDEFEITATAPDKKSRVWTRATLMVAKIIADSAIRQGYTKAVVINTYGGLRSNPIYIAETTGSYDCPES